ncbi:hypothetical protein [Salinisphaera sp. Q1T1-3]|uniref:hypothetical protein n=1 Tax=Salinisphaera sp. Q1T1-3 TaxID=2321229 RepID=UPI000E710A90|nr:hypothetical protein [Salinisphaera sp. Q1T1-3]RJS91283.1 hypothetical protein D3260_16120 [Salinisphaera sp. Q1T1-3]
MAHHDQHPLDHPEVQASSTPKYVFAFILAMGVMIASCLITVVGDMSQLATLTWIGVLALIAVIGQLYFLFKLDTSKAMIWHTVSAAATIPLFFIAIVLTIWMFHHLEMRVMLGAG